MENKKNRKFLSCILSLTLFIPFFVNKLIFIISKFKSKDTDSSEAYSWRLGDINYSVSGKGRPLLLIHDTHMGASLFDWNKNIDSLSQVYKVYAIDLLGYGHSQKVNTTYTAYMYATLINDFISDVIQKPSAVCAAGGSCVFAVSAYKLKSSGFKKLILVSPKGLVDNFAVNNDSREKRLFELPILGESLYLFSVSKTHLKSFILKDLFFAKEHIINDPIINTYYSCSHFGGGNNRYVYASYKSNFMNADIKPYLSDIKIPMLVIWGEKNLINPPENMDIIQKLKPRATCVLFEETRVLPYYENPQQFNKITREFLK